MTILVIAEHQGQELLSATLNTLGAAQQLGAPVHLLIMGDECQAILQRARLLAGVDKVWVAQACHYGQLLAENIALCVLKHARAHEYSHILAPATSCGKNFLPRVAALLGVAMISDMVAIVAPTIFVRPLYAGNVLAKVESLEPVHVISVRPTAFDPVGTSEKLAPLEWIDAGPDAGLSRFVRHDMTRSDRPALASAAVVISGGRALGGAEQFKALLEPLADCLGAAIGASRAAVDAGYAPNDAQVGQTGQVVAPQLYIAIGISGAIQHLAGMKDSKVIVAINKDPDAPIFQVADYGIVGDLFQVVPELTAAIKRHQK